MSSTAWTAPYTRTAKSLHWIMALLILDVMVMGFYMQDLPLSPEKLQLYSWHKWGGVSVMLLLLIRVSWRLAHRPPALPWMMSRRQQTVAHIGHLALYGLMLAIPLSGWLMSSAKGFQTVWFGVVPIPDLLAKDKAWGELLQTVHLSLNLTFIAILVAHVGASLKHHFIDRDDILTRMLPQGRNRTH